MTLKLGWWCRQTYPTKPTNSLCFVIDLDPKKQIRNHFMVIPADQLKDVSIEKMPLVLQTHQCQVLLVACWHMCVPPHLPALAEVCSMVSPRENTNIDSLISSA